jgi:hypothetical protein
MHVKFGENFKKPLAFPNCLYYNIPNILKNGDEGISNLSRRVTESRWFCCEPVPGEKVKSRPGAAGLK